ncbi:MAG: hypothetical protein MI755_22925 [Sphingomonadales bacterium]|nr:hypothetical protein [Sphingomonadales bacterium]
MLRRVPIPLTVALAGFFLAAPMASAAMLLPGSFTTDPIPGTAITIGDPEGLAVIGDVLYVVDDDGPDNRLTSINLTTMAVSQSPLSFPFVSLGSVLPAATSVGTGTLASGSVETFSFTTGAGGQTFAPGDFFSIDLDNDIGGGTPDTVLGTFGAGGPLIGPTLIVDDDGSFFGNGRASGAFGIVNSDGTINIAVSGFADFDFDGINDFAAPVPHPESGDFEVFLAAGDGDDFFAGLLDDIEAITAFGDTLIIGGDDGFDSSGIIVQIDPDTLDVLNALDLGLSTGFEILEVEGLATDGTNLFVSDDDALYVVDPLDGSIIDSAFFPGLDIEGLAFDGRHIILGNDRDPESLVFVDPVTLGIVSTSGEISLPRIPGGESFDPTGLAFKPGLGLILSDNDILSSDTGLIATLPGPAPLGLMGLGLLGLAWTRRRQRR